MQIFVFNPPSGKPVKLFKKKSKTEEINQPDIKGKKGTPPPAKAAPVFITSVLLAFLLPIAIAAFYLNKHYIDDNNSTIAKGAATYYGTLQASTIDYILEEYNFRLQHIAKMNELRIALASAKSYSDAPLVEFTQRINAAFPHAVSLRFIPKDSLSEAEQAGDYPIRYAGLDLIRRTLREKRPESEATKFGDNWYVVITQPILDSNEEANALGVIYLVLNSQPFTSPLEHNSKGMGNTQLTQKYSNSSAQTIIDVGNGEQKTYAVTIPSSNKIWTVTFTPSDQLVSQISTNNQALIIAIASACLFFIVGTLLAYLKFSNTLSKNLTLLGHYLENLIAGKIQEEPLFAFPQIQHILAGLVALRPRSSSEIEFIHSNFSVGEEQKDKTSEAKNSLTNPMFQNDDILDIDMSDDDQDLLGLGDDVAEEREDLPSTLSHPAHVDRIFRAYDIRGIVDTQLTESYVFLIGKAIGSEALEQQQSSIIVGSDARNSSPIVSSKLIQGILSTGCNVINIGVVPSPVLYYATHTLETQSGVIVTASHNAAEYNGFKIIINGKPLFDKAISAIKTRIDSENFHFGQGSHTETNVVPAYIDRICSDVALADSVKIVIDCGNGVAGNIAPQLFQELGCEVIPLYCELDGNFPNHAPDPSVLSNLNDLINRVLSEKADLGIALDGDGDRIGVVSAKGKIIMPDRLLMLFAKDIVSRNPGTDVLFDVKCTRRLNSIISTYGGRPVMWKTGHSFMKEKMAETGALLGGELSGHIFFKERWYGFDDGLYAAARLLEILTIRDQDIDSVFEAFPDDVSTPEIIVAVPDEKKFEIVAALIEEGDFGQGKLTTIDGVRIDFADGWGLVRASNTNPAITMRFEAETQQALDRIRGIINSQLLKIDATLALK